MLTHLIRFSLSDTQDAELDNAANDPLMQEVRLLKVAPAAQALSVQDEYELGGYAGI